MKQSFLRTLYRRTLLLYPESFRHEFGAEILSMFAECKAAQGARHVLDDLLLSAAKQQIRYLSVPAPKNAPLYSEIAWSPNLARILAFAVFVVALTASVLMERGKPQPRESYVRPCGWNGNAANQTKVPIVYFSARNWAQHE